MIKVVISLFDLPTRSMEHACSIDLVLKRHNTDFGIFDIYCLYIWFRMQYGAIIKFSIQNNTLCRNWTYDIRFWRPAFYPWTKSAYLYGRLESFLANDFWFLLLVNRIMGMTGFEPATFCTQNKRATKLRYIPEPTYIVSFFLSLCYSSPNLLS